MEPTQREGAVWPVVVDVLGSKAEVFVDDSVDVPTTRSPLATEVPELNFVAKFYEAPADL